MAGFETSAPKTCTGDCNGGKVVSADQLLTIVTIALGEAPVSACNAGNINHDNQITIDEILTSVNDAATACPV